LQQKRLPESGAVWHDHRNINTTAEHTMSPSNDTHETTFPPRRAVGPAVAVLGAGGIGRHHANWWRVEGARVTAILGRTPETVRASAEKLRALFGFDGAVFTDLPTLLREARPEIVDVCSPAARHFEHARTALTGGCHVLCEKPLVYDAGLADERLLAQGEELVALARAGARRFGLCSQFSVAARTCADLLRARDPAPVTALRLELRSPARGRPPDPAQAWIDLGPHLVAALQTLLPGASPDWETLRVACAGYEADLSFRAGGASVRLTTGFTLAGETANIRRIGINGSAFDLIGENGPDGLFRMRYRSDNGIDEARPDPMRLLIREFLQDRPPLGPDAALANQRLLLRLRAAIASVSNQ